MNEKLAAISASACSDLGAFISEKEDEILTAWDTAVAEAQDQEAKAKFRLGFTITLDLDADKMETALAWSVRHKVSRDQQIPSPNQPELNGMATVEMRPASGGTTGPVPLPVLKGALNELKRQKMARE